MLGDKTPWDLPSAWNRTGAIQHGAFCDRSPQLNGVAWWGDRAPGPTLVKWGSLWKSSDFNVPMHSRST